MRKHLVTTRVATELHPMEYGSKSHKGSRRGGEERNKIPIKISRRRVDSEAEDPLASGHHDANHQGGAHEHDASQPQQHPQFSG